MLSLSSVLDALSRNRKPTAVVNERDTATAAARLVAIVESSDDAIVSKDLDGIITTWNPGAERLFGYAASEIIGQHVTRLIPADRRGEETNILAQIRLGRRVEPYETVRLHKDGTFLDVSLTVSPIRGPRGTIVGASKIARDISKRKRLEERQELILGEMKHRVKNLEAVIQSLGRGAIPKNEPAVTAFFDAFCGRLHALLSVGDLVVSSMLRTADLRDVTTAALAPFRMSNHAARIISDGPSLFLSEDTAGRLALAIHELATNAIKYGALKFDGGTVQLNWTVEPEIGQWASRPNRMERAWLRHGFRTNRHGVRTPTYSRGYL